VDGVARLVRAAIALACVAAPAWCAAAEEVVTIPTREGVTDSYLIIHNPDATPRIAVIAFIGSEGVINLAKRAEAGPVRFGAGANALIRMRGQVANRDIAYVIVDAPSDRLPQGMSDDFRMSATHAADIRAVIADLRKRYPDIRIDLIGTSRGTISAAPLAVALGDVVHGVVLSSTVTVATRAGPGLSRFDFATIKVPLLFVHSRDDACRVSPYGNIARVAREGMLLTVDGGDPPQSDACEPLSPHGYFGREAAVAKAIQAWLLGQEIPHEIP
jgi:pimeloyl-ACP methyl ester carboxylesterase